MPHHIPSSSPRKAAAEVFSRELRVAMAARGLGRRRLGQMLGMTSQGCSIIAEWRRAATLPSLANVQKLVTALDWPELRRIGTEARTYTCPCGRQFVSDAPGRVTYCSPRCQSVMQKWRQGESTRVRADIAERRLTDYRAAVEARCRACEPNGFCWERACELRPVSPLGLAPGVTA